MTVNKMIFDLNLSSNQKIKIHGSMFFAIDLIAGPLSKSRILKTRINNDVIELDVADE